jgi:translocation and assembly module TamB
MHRAALHTLRVVAVSATFAVSLVGSAALHLNTPSCRRLVVDAVNRALAPNLVGKVTIERVDTLGVSGLEGLHGRVDDRDGRTLLRLDGVRASIRLGTLLGTLIARESVVVHLPMLFVDKADVCLDADEDGTLRIARAFESSTPPSPSGPGKGVHLRLSGIRVSHARVHGEMGVVPPLDTEIDDVGGTFEVGPGTLGVHVQSATLVTSRFPGGVVATGAIEAHLAQSTLAGGQRALTASWQGKVGAVAGSAQLTYDGDRMDATVDVPLATPQDVQSLCPACQLGDVARAHAEAHGKLNELAVRLTGKVGAGSVDLDGSVSVTDSVHGRAHAVLRDVDVHAVTSSGPASSLGADVDATFATLSSGGLSVESDVDFHGGTVASVALPKGPLHASIQRSKDGTFTASARGTVDEPGAPADVVASLAPKGNSYHLTFGAQSGAIDLARVPALAPAHASGRGSASVHGTLALDSKALEATVESEASGIALPGTAVREATLTARISGTASTPTLDAELDAHDSELPGHFHFGSAHVEAHGTPASMPVTVALSGGPVDVDGRATLSAAAPGALRKVTVRLAHEDEHADVSAALVRISGEEVRIDDGQIDGLGRPVRASVQATRGSVRVVAHAGRVEVDRVVRLLGLSHVQAGRLDFDVDMLVRGRSAQGHATIGVVGLAFDEWEGVNAHADLQVSGRRVSGRVTASAADVGDVDAQADRLEVAGTDALSPSSWRRLFGGATLAGHVDLAQLAKRLPQAPSGKLAGTFDLTGRFQRDSPSDDTPALQVDAQTHGLTFTPAGATTPRFAGVDLGVQAYIDGSTGKTSVDASLRDALGPVAALAANSEAVPYARILASNEGLLDVLRPVPFNASVSFPERDIDALPAAVRPRALHGRGSATITWNGPLIAPKIDATATARAAHTDQTVIAMPSDLDLEAHYVNPRGDVTLRASSRGRELMKTSVHVRAAAADLLRATSLDDAPWEASAETHLTKFPLQSIGALDKRAITGKATGDLTIEGLHRDARAHLSMVTTALQVGGVECKSARVDASADGHGVDASASVEAEDGSATAHARLGGHWGRELLPAIDASQPATVNLAAKQLRAALLLPLLPDGTFSSLDGRLSGSVDVRIDPKAGTFQPQGTLALSNATFELPTIGGEFHDAKATLTMSPDGVVRLEDVSARGLTGQIQGAMSLRFNGLAFGGARGTFRVPEKQPLPLVLDGVHLGTVDGKLDLAMDPSADHGTLDVTVDVPTLHVLLPDATGHDVQTLGPLDGVDVGVRGTDAEFAPARLDAAGEEAGARTSSGPLVRVTTKLGSDVAVRRGTNLDIRLAGSPTFTMNPTGPTATGQIRLVRGSIDVEGKRFEIQEGSTVTFIDDPTNPQVVLTAMWKAQDETTTVFADFVGPLKTAKVTLRSEPTLSQSEILSLILFGTSDVNTSANAGMGSPEASGAASVAGSAATAPINKALGGVNRMLDNFGLVGNISTKIDTSTTSPRPEVEIQIARDISLQIAWVLGVPPPGTNPDSTLATVSWRFLRRWSLVTTVGDAGTSIVDLVWQKRY